MSPPSTLELRIQSTTTEGRYRLVAEWTRPGGLPVRGERIFELDRDELEDEDSPLRYGEILGRALFVERVRDLFAQARADDAGLRVLLAVESKSLRPLRWERLAAPFGDDWRLLGHSQRTPFSLYLPSGNDRRFPPFGRRELRALVIVANPDPDNRYGLAPFDEAQAIDTVLEGLGDIPYTVLGKDPRADGPPTVAEVVRRLTVERYTLAHFVCHGAYSAKSGETAIFLDDGEGKAEAVTASRLIRGVKNLSEARGVPHLTFLAVCDSAKPEAEGALGGLGQRMVRELGMPAVVAMTERVSQQTAFTLGRGFYSRLQEHGEVDRALVEASVEIQDREDMVVPALFSRLAGRPLFTDALDRPLSHADFVATAERLEALFLERAPVLREHVQVLAAELAVDSATLTGEAAREHERCVAEVENLCENVLELSFSALAHGREPPPYGVQCPFPGLRAFTAEQRRYFRGRDALVDSLLSQLDDRPFLAVLGSSGCGKSSLVMAGVIPRLQDATPELEVACFKPGDHPMVKLEEALEQLEGTAESVLYVDQFEEAFTLCRAEPERKAFFDALLAAVEVGRRVIISMRADFIGECAQHDGLRAQIEGLRLIPPMSADELRNAIEEQGNAAGLRYETGLCELILEDLEGEPGAMPLLQHALRQLYERRHGRWLRVQAYEELGRVQKAITTTAENLWERLPEADQDRLRAIMLDLTELRDGEGGSPDRFMRRRVPLRHLYYTRATTTSTEGSIQRLVDLLADERLLVKSRDEGLGDVVEVAHEALLRGWERLQAWLESSRESIRMRQDLEHAMASWRAHELSTAYLEHVHERGELVRTFLRTGALKLDPALEEYFQACEAEERRQREDKERQQQEKLEAAQKLAEEQSLRLTQLRRSVATIAVVGLMAAAAAVVAFVLFGKARDEERAANLARDEAELRREEARASEREARRAKEQTEDSLERQKALTAELKADQPGQRIDALIRSVELTKERPLHVDALPIEARRAVFASTRGLHFSVGLQHARDRTVVDIAFSSDGRRLATAGRDHTAKIWDTGTGQRLATLEGHARAVESVAFVPGSEGERLLTADGEGRAKLWSVDGKELEFAAPDEPTTAVAFSADGPWVATGSETGAVTLWTEGTERSWGPTPALEATGESVSLLEPSPAGRRLLVVHNGEYATEARIVDAGTEARRVVELLGHRSRINEAVFTPDGTRVVTGDEKGWVRVWDVQRGTLLRTYRGKGEVKALAVAPTHGRIAAALERVVELWDIERDEKVATLRGHRANVRDVAFAPDGRLLATVSRDKALRLWDADTGASLAVLEGHVDHIERVELSPDGRRIATADEAGMVRLWHAESDTESTLLDDEGTEADRLAISPDGSRIAMATADGTTILGFDEEEPLELDVEYLTNAMAWSPDGDTIVTVGDDRVPTICSAHTGKVVRTLAVHAADIASMEFSPDGGILALGDNRGTLVLLSPEKRGGGVRIDAHRLAILDLDFSSDGSHIVTSSADKTAALWNLKNFDDEHSTPDASFEHPEMVMQGVLSLDGKYLATGDSTGGVRIWRVRGHDPPEELTGNLATIRAIEFSPDGRRLVTAGLDAAVRLWDVDTRRELYTLGFHAREVVAARFTDDGRSVVTGSIDGVVRRWSVDVQARMGFACKVLEALEGHDAEVETICGVVRGAATPPRAPSPSE